MPTDGRKTGVFEAINHYVFIKDVLKKTTFG